MKMIRHKAVGQNMAMGQNEFSDFLQKIDIVLWLKEYRLLVISPVVNVV
jgi:hypothetical protein